MNAALEFDLTEGEFRVLCALYDASDGNGHDFGIVEEARYAVDSPRALAGFVSNLVQKGVIICGAPERINHQGEPITQFIFKKKGDEDKYQAAARIGRFIDAEKKRRTI